MKITEGKIRAFANSLKENEKATATIEKYNRDLRALAAFLGNEKITKKKLLEYKQLLCENHKKTSVNSAIAAINSFLAFAGRGEMRLKSYRVQKSTFYLKEKELTKAEYERLVSEAEKRGNIKLMRIMQAICSTGIRVSELRYITVSALKKREAMVECKGKMRKILLPGRLCKILEAYTKKEKITEGAVFVTKNGKPIDRSNIWKAMKDLCKAARVSPDKVFPHNLRHLFARIYYSIQKDIVRLSDILGHSNINTTRVYTVETGEIHRRQLERLGILKC